MAVSTVSSYSVLQSTINDVSKVESDLTHEQEQLSSGNKSKDFTGLASQIQQYLSIDSIIGKTDQYLNDNTVVETRIASTSTALSQLVQVGTNLQDLISQRRSGASNNAAFANELDGLWQQISTQINSSVDGQYLFSGTKTTQPPVNPALFPKLLSPGVPDASYYQGSQQDITVTAQDNNIIKYNIRADAPGFQNLLAGLATAKAADINGNDADFAKAYSLVQQGLQGLISTQATVDSNKVQFTTIDKNLQNQKLYWQGIQEGIGNTDVVSVSTQVSINQGILQAAFQAFAKISSLRLGDFLK